MTRSVSLRVGIIGIIAAVVLMLVISRPAIPVLVVAILVAAIDIAVRHRFAFASLVKSANLPMVVGLFVLATCVSVASRYWHLSQHLIGTAGSWQTAGVAAASSNLINNLPAAAMLSAKFPAHPYSLLFGLISDPTSPWSVPCHPCCGSRWLEEKGHPLGVDVHKNWGRGDDRDAVRMSPCRLR